MTRSVIMVFPAVLLAHTAARADEPPPPLALADLSARVSVSAEIGTGAIDDDSSEVTVRSAGLRGALALRPWLRVFGSFGAATASSNAGEGDAVGNVRLGALLTGRISGRDGVTRRGVAVTLTLPTASGEGDRDGAARAAADAMPIDAIEAFSPGGLGVAVDGIHRVELGPAYVQLEAGAHLLRSSGMRPPFTRFPYDRLSDETTAWGRAALGAGARVLGPVGLGADVAALFPVRTGSFDADQMVVAARVGGGVEVGGIHATVQLRRSLNDPGSAESGVGIVVAAGVRW